MDITLYFETKRVTLTPCLEEDLVLLFFGIISRITAAEATLVVVEAYTYFEITSHSVITPFCDHERTFIQTFIKDLSKRLCRLRHSKA